MVYVNRILFLVVSTVIMAQTVGQKATDEWLSRPVDDRVFASYLDFFQYDPKLPFNLKTIRAGDQEGIHTEHISFQSTPGVTVTANISWPVESAPKARAGIILLHGGTAPGKDSSYMPVISELLTRGGFCVLNMDMQYFGERKTGLLTTFTEEEKHDRLYNQPVTYLAFVIQTIKDIRRAADLMIQHAGVSERRLGILAFSRGAMMASIAGGVEKRLKAVVLCYGGHFDTQENRHLAAACPANYIGRISPRALLMINGTRDASIVKDTSVDPLFRVARMPKEIIWEDAGHQLPGQENLSKTLSWLREKLK
jgi:dienelactone hydrolase